MTTATMHYAAGGEWLQKSTHLLIAGATGSGKSNALHIVLQAASAAPDGDVPIFYAEFRNIAFPLISPMEIRYHVGIVNQLCGVL